MALPCAATIIKSHQSGSMQKRDVPRENSPNVTHATFKQPPFASNHPSFVVLIAWCIRISSFNHFNTSLPPLHRVQGNHNFRLSTTSCNFQTHPTTAIMRTTRRANRATTTTTTPTPTPTHSATPPTPAPNKSSNRVALSKIDDYSV